MTQRQIAITLLIIAVFALLSGSNPLTAVGQTGCRLLDKNLPSQFISFEGVSQSPSIVTLVLHNNTSCTIIVETDDKEPLSLRKNGTVYRIHDLPNSVWLPVHYLIEDTRRRRAPERAFGWGDSVFTYEVSAGHSALFDVPLFNFRKHKDVLVPFNYGWEVDRAIGMEGVGGVVHRVYFLGRDLPKSLLSKKP